jgi:ribosomal-protein-alanine N-acetyltransferase
MITLETPRLHLRQFLPKDALVFFLLNSDEEVVRYTGDRAFRSVGESLALIEGYRQYADYGLGRLVMVEKSTGDVIGWCGLKYLADEAEVDIGYRIFKRYWNQGFTTEAAQACLKYGFEVKQLKSIIGRANASNIGSIRVFDKLGMTFEKDDHLDGKPWKLYRISSEEWNQLSGNAK